MLIFYENKTHCSGLSRWKNLTFLGFSFDNTGVESETQEAVKVHVDFKGAVRLCSGSMLLFKGRFPIVPSSGYPSLGVAHDGCFAEGILTRFDSNRNWCEEFQGEKLNGIPWKPHLDKLCLFFLFEIMSLHIVRDIVRDASVYFWFLERGVFFCNMLPCIASALR